MTPRYKSNDTFVIGSESGLISDGVTIDTSEEFDGNNSRKRKKRRKKKKKFV